MKIKGRELFKYRNSHDKPFEGVLGDTPELRIIHSWLGMDSQDEKIWFDIDHFVKFEGLQKDEAQKALDNLVHHKIIEEDGDKYSMNFKSDFWKGITTFNFQLIDVIVENLKEQDEYIRRFAKLNDDGTYQMDCPLCTSIMVDDSWGCLPLGGTISLTCPKCKLSIGLTVDREKGDIPSRSLIPHSRRAEVQQICPVWFEEYNNEIEGYLQELDIIYGEE